MTKNTFSPYHNEADSIQLADLTIENRLDRISIYGSIDLWKDKGGLKAAQQLKTIIDQTISELEKCDLPDKVELAKSETVANPFE
jgi:hypothetical protein